MISIIVPVYNVEKYLHRCVDSILKQTFTDYEIILVDDGSTDSSAQICDEYASIDSRIRVIHKENGGLSSARNAGLDAARGKYVGFVDSDDYVSSDMYEKLVAALGDDTEAISNCMYVRAYESGETSASRVPHFESESFEAEKFLEELLLHVGDVSVCTKLFFREAIGDLRFPVGILNEDLVFIINYISKLKRIHFVGSVGYYYFVRENSITSGFGKTFIDMQKNALWVLDCVRNEYPSLAKQALRFALYQNMAYLLAVPKEQANKENEIYVSALRFVRRNALRALVNRYLRGKERLIIFGLAIAPKTVAKIFKKRKRSK